MFSVKTTMTITGDKNKFRRSADRMRNLERFMGEVGNLGVSSSLRRLNEAVSQNDGLSTGLLGASLAVFEVSIDEVTIGSNLPYAAQRNFGGTIYPITAKALAIPLDDRIKRLGLGPRDVDPQREILHFVPAHGGRKGNIIGLLVDGEGAFGTPDKALYALATSVFQPGAFFLGWDDEDVRTIERDIFPRYLTEP